MHLRPAHNGLRYAKLDHVREGACPDPFWLFAPTIQLKV